MEARLSLLERKRADILRQIAPDLAQELVAGKLCLRAERADLPQRMYARVRPPGARNLDALGKQPRQQHFELALYGVVAVALPLPAVVTAAVIAERELEIPHGVFPFFSSCFIIPPLRPDCKPRAGQNQNAPREGVRGTRMHYDFFFQYRPSKLSGIGSPASISGRYQFSYSTGIMSV